MPLFMWALFVGLLRFYFLCGAAGIPGAACCVRPGCAVDGGPPASRPRRELRSARRLEARPGPDTAHGHRSLTHLRALARQALAPLTPAPTPNFARNSPTTASSFELRSLELQRFWALLKLQPIELRASFRRQRRATAHGHRSLASPPPGPRTPSPRSPHSCAHTQFRMQFPYDCFKF